MLFESVVARIPQLSRGIVWCRKCGGWMYVDSARCLSHGWPKCCGETMTIDSPVERAAQMVTEEEIGNE